MFSRRIVRISDLRIPVRNPDENERVDLPVLVGLCGFQQALRLRRGQKDDAAVVLLEFADLRRRTLDPSPFNRLVEEVRESGQLPVHRRWPVRRQRLARLELLAALDRLGEAVLFVALDIKTGDLTHPNLSQEWDEALFKPLALAFNFFSAFLVQTIQIEQRSSRQRQRYLPSLWEIQATFARVLTDLGNELLRRLP